ncbi:MAG: sigma-70 family RNA polymerase sigma factor [Lentisphaeria bacterium]|nr:sigma-70 family RNA polymerase sigma factor [Lentisphaeria bacterium]
MSAQPSTNVSREETDALIRRILNGDSQAFAELVDTMKHLAYAPAYRRTRDRELSMEIVQDSFLKLYRKLPEWDFSCHVKTWLYRVVTNACIDHHRRNKAMLVSIDDPETGNSFELAASSTRDDPARRAASTDWRRLAEMCINELPERMQGAFRLKYIDGLSLKEVAEVQQCSIGTIKATLHKATRKVQERLLTFETI